MHRKLRDYLRDYLQQYKDQIEEKLYFRLLRNPIRALDSKDEKIKDIIKDARPISDFLLKSKKQDLRILSHF
jgi:histidyl-tRNA synthetase